MGVCSSGWGSRGGTLVEVNEVLPRRVFFTVWVDGGYCMYGNKSIILVVKENSIIGIVVHVIVN